jgi:hypothetical protein
LTKNNELIDLKFGKIKKKKFWRTIGKIEIVADR